MWQVRALDTAQATMPAPSLTPTVVQNINKVTKAWTANTDEMQGAAARLPFLQQQAQLQTMLEGITMRLDNLTEQMGANHTSVQHSLATLNGDLKRSTQRFQYNQNQRAYKANAHRDSKVCYLLNEEPGVTPSLDDHPGTLLELMLITPAQLDRLLQHLVV
eukprot:jgi/Chlat1/7559/Chrsp63S07057